MTQLSQQRIVDAAIKILQRYGLQDLSIRKVANLLHVQPGALYWHFPHKQALLGAVAEHILKTKTPSPDSRSTDSSASPRWDDKCLAVLADLRNKLLAYRDGAELVSAAFSAETCTIPHIDEIATILENHNSAVATSSTTAAYALIIFVLGACVDEQTRSQLAELSDATDKQVDSATQESIFTVGARLFLRGIEASS